MTPDEQLRLWVEGNSVHNDDDEGGECCPDFSCCRPELLAPREIREAFVRAGAAERHKYLYGFLGAALAGYTKRVHVAGQDPGD